MVTATAQALQLGNTPAAQWEQFKTNHVGAWRGLWETFDALGDVVDRTETLFDVALDPTGDHAVLSQTLPTAVTQSDCETCFDGVQEQRIPMGQASSVSLGRTTVLGPVLVNGPVVLRSGAMATELALRHRHGRARVTFQHAPVWHKDSDLGVGLPDALELFRVVLRREALRDYCPTPENEAAQDEVFFWRPTPPFKWAEDGHLWRGETTTSRCEDDGGTTGPERLDMTDEATRWHERFRGEDPEATWHLRLPGGLLVQCPRRIYRGSLGDGENTSDLFRMAWMCEEDRLLRATAGVRAFKTMSETDGDYVVLPPVLETIVFDDVSKTANE